MTDFEHVLFKTDPETPNPTVKIKAFGRILQDRMDGEKKDPPFRMGVLLLMVQKSG